MTTYDFVEQEISTTASIYLRNIRRGGDNNFKGFGYETSFAVSKICDVAANHASLDDFIISRQEIAFVDDLCIREKSPPRKINYQAKNSDGNAASWDTDIEQRFRWQGVIDEKLHRYPVNQQILLVSCPAKAKENRNKIPPDLKEWCSSEYFPYATSSVRLILSCPTLRSNLEKLCSSHDLSVIDAAFRLVLSAWLADDGPVHVGDVIGMAKSSAKPDIFADFIHERHGPPGWLLHKCSAFDGFDARLEQARIVVSYNGVEVSLSADSSEPDPAMLDGLASPGEFLAFLMSRARIELCSESQ